LSGGDEGPSPQDEVLWQRATGTADAATAEAVEALSEAGIPCILLRGPAFARRLYNSGERRYYDDGDLLVRPADVTAAEGVLSRLGFHTLVVHIPGERPPHASSWRRDRDGANLDLHWTHWGVDAPPDDVWEALSARTEPLDVGGTTVEAPDAPVLAFLAATHACEHGAKHRKSLRDLERALARLSPDAWREAAALAARLQAMPVFVAGLTLAPAGEALAAELGLPRGRPVAIALAARSAPPTAEGFLRFAEARGVRAKTAYTARQLVPPPAWMRNRVPAARRGPLWLAGAYVWRLVWLARHAGPGLHAYVQARRESAGV
jgi:hypothetical protein